MIDIIIPTYKNKDGLRTTLNSIDWSNLNFLVTIIDDASQLDYSDILSDFPKIHQLIILPQNVGPGMARQAGITATNSEYILFIDTGDYFISSEAFNNVPNIIQQNLDAEVLMWHFFDGKTQSSSTNNHLHGKVYQRHFIETNHIGFCPAGSYANEDIGFNRACRMLLREKGFKEIKQNLIYWSRNDNNSLTLKDNGAFSYQKQNLGLANNMIYVLNTITVDEQIKLEEISEIIGHMYFSFVCTVIERPQYIEDAWRGARLFYNEIYKKYSIPEDLIQMRYSQLVTRLRKRFHSFPFTPNLRRFIIELDKFETAPKHYLTFSKN